MKRLLIIVNSNFDAHNIYIYIFNRDRKMYAFTKHLYNCNLEIEKTGSKIFPTININTCIAISTNIFQISVLLY